MRIVFHSKSAVLITDKMSQKRANKISLKNGDLRSMRIQQIIIQRQHNHEGKEQTDSRDHMPHIMLVIKLQ